MEPQKPETIEERMLLAEVEMKRLGEEFRSFNEAICSDLSDVRQEGVKTRDMVVQTNGLVALMPEKISKAIDEREEAREKKRKKEKEENKGKRIEIRDWVIGAAVIAGPIVAVLVAKG